MREHLHQFCLATKTTSEDNKLKANIFRVPLKVFHVFLVAINNEPEILNDQRREKIQLDEILNAAHFNTHEKIIS